MKVWVLVGASEDLYPLPGRAVGELLFQLVDVPEGLLGPPRTTIDIGLYDSRDAKMFSNLMKQRRDAENGTLKPMFVPERVPAEAIA